MIPSDSAPDVPQLKIPSRASLIATVLVFVVVTTVILAWVAGQTSGIVAAVVAAAVLLITTSPAAMLIFRRYHLALENAQYVVEDQAHQIFQHRQNSSVRPVAPSADPKALAASKQEAAKLGEQLSEARAALESVRRQLEEAAGAAGAGSEDRRPATHDALTGLRYGSAAFEQRIGELIADSQHSGAFHGVLMIGLDELDRVLDQVGPIASDEYIWTVAQLIADNAPADRNLFRVSAKHFGLLLPAASDKLSVATAQKIISAVSAREFSSAGKTYQGSVSIGALSVGLADVSASDIVERAIHAHSLASSAGGDRLHVESMLPMLEKRNRDQSLRDWLEDRLDHEHQRLAAQAIVPLGGKASGAVWHELLLRIEDDDGVWLPPEHYVDVLERLQITSRIDRWVMQTALRKTPVGGPEQASQRRLSINIFGSSLARDSFLAEMRDVLANSIWPTGQICFEIEEATIIQRPSRVAAFMEAASEFGCQFAIDRYRGVAGLSALRTFPVQYIKLHDSLLVRRTTDVVDRAQVEWLIHSAHLCGAKVVAVGVRDEEMLARVRELKVDFVQGYALAPPSPWAG